MACHMDSRFRTRSNPSSFIVESFSLSSWVSSWPGCLALSVKLVNIAWQNHFQCRAKMISRVLYICEFMERVEDWGQGKDR